MGQKNSTRRVSQNVDVPDVPDVPDVTNIQASTINIVTPPTNDEKTPQSIIIDMIRNQKFENVKKMISEGSVGLGDIKSPITFYNETLLHIMCASGNIETLKFLLEIIEPTHNDLMALTKGGGTPLMYACKAKGCGNDCVTSSYERCMNKCNRMQLDIIKFLCENFLTKDDIMVKNYYGDNCLICASRRGHLNILEYLISKYNLTKEDLCVKNEKGESVLSLAKQKNYSDIIAFIEKTFEKIDRKK